MTPTAIITYAVAFTGLGIIISLVVVAVHEPDIARVPRKALWAFLKLVVGSAIAIVMVEILYAWTIFTYPVLLVLLAYLIFGDRLWRRWKLRRLLRKAADHSPGS
jgi:hypothetical protein